MGINVAGPSYARIPCPVIGLDGLSTCSFGIRDAVERLRILGPLRTLFIIFLGGFAPRFRVATAIGHIFLAVAERVLHSGIGLALKVDHLRNICARVTVIEQLGRNLAAGLALFGVARDA